MMPANRIIDADSDISMRSCPSTERRLRTIGDGDIKFKDTHASAKAED